MKKSSEEQKKFHDMLDESFNTHLDATMKYRPIPLMQLGLLSENKDITEMAFRVLFQLASRYFIEDKNPVNFTWNDICRISDSIPSINHHDVCSALYTLARCNLCRLTLKSSLDANPYVFNILWMDPNGSEYSIMAIDLMIDHSSQFHKEVYLTLAPWLMEIV